MTTFRFASCCVLALAVAACGKSSPFGNRGAPDEFAISRQAPLVVPPDYSLTPPKPGTARPQAVDAQTEAKEALFGNVVKPGPKSPAELSLLDKAGADRSDPSVRSNAGDKHTYVVDKGAMLKDIVNAPAGTKEPAVAQVTLGGA